MMAMEMMEADGLRMSWLGMITVSDWVIRVLVDQPITINNATDGY